ncbi:MAG: hypothetical protein U1C55_00085 [Smithellaceae bacterium]|nr:hypothetical protein [Smithellaceae bacterium]
MIECATPGSDKLCDLVKCCIRQQPEIKAMLMKEHGILTMVPDLKYVYYLADLVADAAKIAFIEALIT